MGTHLHGDVDGEVMLSNYFNTDTGQLSFQKHEYKTNLLVYKTLFKHNSKQKVQFINMLTQSSKVNQAK